MGQLLAGGVADVLGRKRIFVFTAVLIIFGNLGAACVPGVELGAQGMPTNTEQQTAVYMQIAFFRFFLGIGVITDVLVSTQAAHQWSDADTTTALPHLTHHAAGRWAGSTL